MQFDKSVKVLLVGSKNIGKTNLMNRFDGKGFNPNQIQKCVMNEFVTRNYDWDGTLVRIVVYKGMVQMPKHWNNYLYTGSRGFVLTYDITNRESFDQIHNEMSTIEQ